MCQTPEKIGLGRVGCGCDINNRLGCINDETMKALSHCIQMFVDFEAKARSAIIKISYITLAVFDIAFYYACWLYFSEVNKRNLFFVIPASRRTRVFQVSAFTSGVYEYAWLLLLSSKCMRNRKQNEYICLIFYFGKLYLLTHWYRRTYIAWGRLATMKNIFSN